MSSISSTGPSTGNHFSTYGPSYNPGPFSFGQTVLWLFQSENSPGEANLLFESYPRLAAQLEHEDPETFYAILAERISQVHPR